MGIAKVHFGHIPKMVGYNMVGREPGFLLLVIPTLAIMSKKLFEQSGLISNIQELF